MEILTSGFAPMNGIAIGHWTDRDAQTGCTVIRFDQPALTAVDPRGAATGSRELDLLHLGKAVQRPDAILLSGGSAFGLAAADGVMRWMQEHERGYPTPAGPVPIVPAAVLYDLATGDPTAPGASAGYHATHHALPIDQLETGRVGAGTGATLGAIGGPQTTRAGGLVAAQVALHEGTVTVIAAINAFGALPGGPTDPRRHMLALGNVEAPVPFGESTSLLAAITDIPLDHDSLQRMTVAMHDGLARAIVPVHTIVDGDMAFASTTSEADRTSPGQSMRAAIATELATESAIATLRGSTSAQ